MWTYEAMDSYVKENLKETRYIHTLGVVETAIALAKINGASEEKAKIAALLHDAAKNMKIEEQVRILKENNIELDEITINSPQILHGFVAGILARDIMGVEDSEILSAIACHTTGKDNMSLLDKIIYISDYIEPNRNYNGVEELRELTFKDLNSGLLKGIENTIIYVIKLGQLVHPLTLEARNYLILESQGNI